MERRETVRPFILTKCSQNVRTAKWRHVWPFLFLSLTTEGARSQNPGARRVLRARFEPAEKNGACGGLKDGSYRTYRTNVTGHLSLSCVPFTLARDMAVPERHICPHAATLLAPGFWLLAPLLSRHEFRQRHHRIRMERANSVQDLGSQTRGRPVGGKDYF